MKSVIRLVRDAWLIVGMTLVLVLLGNEALKAWIPENSHFSQVKIGANPPNRQAAAAYQGADWVDGYYAEHRQARAMHWQPYVYWRRDPFAGEAINIDEFGHRQTLGNAGNEQSRQVFVFGGSTVWGTGVPDRHTIPSELAVLSNRRGMSVQVTNLGESGYVSSQGLISLLRELQAGAQPDLVIFYDGVNDVFSALQSGQAGLPQNEMERQRDFRVTNGLDNYLAGFPATLEGVNRLAARWSSGQAVPATEELARQLVDIYLVNVRTIRVLGEAFGFKTLFFWQPSIFSKSSPATGEQAIIDASLAAHRDLQLAANAEIRRRGQNDSQVIDLSTLFDSRGDAIYLDFCHLAEVGNRLVAATIFDHLPLREDW